MSQEYIPLESEVSESAVLESPTSNFLLSWANRGESSRETHQQHRLDSLNWRHFSDTLLGGISSEPLNSEIVLDQAVMERVGQASESDEAIERDYELRHEKKDEATETVGATQVGAIMHGAVQKHQQGQATQQLASVETLSRVSQYQTMSNGALYRKAIATGVVLGLICVAIIILSVIMTK